RWPRGRGGGRSGWNARPPSPRRGACPAVPEGPDTARRLLRAAARTGAGCPRAAGHIPAPAGPRSALASFAVQLLQLLLRQVAELVGVVGPLLILLLDHALGGRGGTVCPLLRGLEALVLGTRRLHGERARLAPALQQTVHVGH